MQLVTQATYKSKILDILRTILSHLYLVPLFTPAVPPDNPLSGVPSDHSAAVDYPLSSGVYRQLNEYVWKVARPLQESGIQEFDLSRGLEIH